MRFSKKMREEAIMICAVAASTPWLTCNYRETRMSLGLPSYSQPGTAWGHTLESLAWRYVCQQQGCDHSTAEVDAEAEALLRTGWSPP